MPQSPLAMFSGRCLCRSIRYSCDAAPLWQRFCHCESCRRATSSPLTAFFAISDPHWRWLGHCPTAYASSSFVTRFFCPTCGTPIAYRNDRDASSEMHFHANTLDEPTLFCPSAHDFWNERMPWLHVMDELIKE